jgi:uncharacterized protein
MKLMIFGATGRVGQSLVHKAKLAGHDMTILVRDALRVKTDGLKTYVGDVRDKKAVTRAMQDKFDAVIVCLGETGLRQSTIMEDGMASIIAAMQANVISRLIMVSGTAEMPQKTAFGKIYTAILRRTPIGHAIRDHDAAFELIKATSLNWTLVGCNYLKTGPERGKFKSSLLFPGGFKIIHPPDVANFILEALDSKKYDNSVVGIWY